MAMATKALLSSLSPPSPSLASFASRHGRLLSLSLPERRSPPTVMVRVRASAGDGSVTQSRGLSREMGGQWLSSTTRHIRLYIGYIDPTNMAMDRTQLDKISLILDPDDEFVWPEDKCQKVYDYLLELLDNYAGAPMTEYTLRLIGSDMEHYIRKMLLNGEIKYNLDCRVLNFSMGKPYVDAQDMETA